MGTQNIGIPKGTRDFSPTEMVRRNYIFNIIKTIFELYGYQSIETPAMENLSTLLGKYGEEGDKLLFKVLNSGDFMKGLEFGVQNSENTTFPKSETLEKLSRKISEKGLRYDLTVPFARYVVQHRNEISFPFKRYQMQPVWRADKPQRGRYREFYQCDVDVIGSDSLLNEVELIQIINDVFIKFGIKITIKINNRKILAGIAEIAGVPDKITDITVAIDKLDKIGLENVNKELEEKGISKEAIEKIQPIIEFSNTPPLTPPQSVTPPLTPPQSVTPPLTPPQMGRGTMTENVDSNNTPPLTPPQMGRGTMTENVDSNNTPPLTPPQMGRGTMTENVDSNNTPPLTPPQMGRGTMTNNIVDAVEQKVSFIKEFLKDSKTGLKGIEETEIILGYLKETGLTENIEFDLVLARGLNYYTGTIIEVKAQDVEIGSICGGGRYDDLTGIFGLPNVSGVGISFGADRIYDVLNELKLFPAETASITKILFINFGGESERYCLKLLRDIRQRGINAELYPSSIDIRQSDVRQSDNKIKSSLKKQMQYANNKNIPYVVMAGENELKEGKVTLKDMKTGEQMLITNYELGIRNY